MSKKFVRNITNTKLRGEQAEPLHTNVQNDLLSDDVDVFVRNKREYHALTDNLKTDELEVEQFLSVDNKTKNGIKIIGKPSTKTNAENGTNNDTIMNPLRVKEAIDFQVPKIIDELVPQSDWEEEDEESQAFIKNKPSIGGGVSQEYVDDQDEETLTKAKQYTDDHINDKNNPHAVTKSDIGLDKVENLPVANLEQATTPTNSVYMTPRRVMDSILLLQRTGHAITQSGDFVVDYQYTNRLIEIQVQNIVSEFALDLSRFPVYSNIKIILTCQEVNPGDKPLFTGIKESSVKSNIIFPLEINKEESHILDVIRIDSDSLIVVHNRVVV